MLFKNFIPPEYPKLLLLDIYYICHEHWTRKFTKQNISAYIFICIINNFMQQLISHQFLCDIWKNSNIFEFVFSLYLHFYLYVLLYSAHIIRNWRKRDNSVEGVMLPFHSIDLFLGSWCLSKKYIFQKVLHLRGAL